MAPATACPICADTSLHPYARHGILKLDPIPESPLKSYFEMRRRVLFEIWMPGADRAVLEVLVCRACGFTFYSPRPTEQEVEAKYRFLQQHDPMTDLGSDVSADLARSEALFAKLDMYVRPGSRVLDCGGGTGKLMRAFLAAGCEAFLVDYCTEPIEGVKKLGDTLEDVDPGERFDLAVSSHVLEHLVDPVGHARRIGDFLHHEGVLYAEVPFELHPYMECIARDPVTHLNYFTLTSLGRTMEAASLSVRAREQGHTVYAGWPIQTLSVVADKRPADSSAAADGFAEAMGHLTPSLRTRLKRMVGRG